VTVRGRVTAALAFTAEPHRHRRVSRGRGDEKPVVTVEGHGIEVGAGIVTVATGTPAPTDAVPLVTGRLS
jgi:hypothetical protein